MEKLKLKKAAVFFLFCIAVVVFMALPCMAEQAPADTENGPILIDEGTDVWAGVSVEHLMPLRYVVTDKTSGLPIEGASIEHLVESEARSDYYFMGVTDGLGIWETMVSPDYIIREQKNVEETDILMRVLKHRVSRDYYKTVEGVADIQLVNTLGERGERIAMVYVEMERDDIAIPLRYLVTDENGMPVEGVLIEYFDQHDQKFARVGVTGKDGIWEGAISFSLLPDEAWGKEGVYDTTLLHRLSKTGYLTIEGYAQVEVKKAAGGLEAVVRIVMRPDEQSLPLRYEVVNQKKQPLQGVRIEHFDDAQNGFRHVGTTDQNGIWQGVLPLSYLPQYVLGVENGITVVNQPGVYDSTLRHRLSRTGYRTLDGLARVEIEKTGQGVCAIVRVTMQEEKDETIPLRYIVEDQGGEPLREVSIYHYNETERRFLREGSTDRDGIWETEIDRSLLPKELQDMLDGSTALEYGKAYLSQLRHRLTKTGYVTREGRAEMSLEKAGSGARAVVRVKMEKKEDAVSSSSSDAEESKAPDLPGAGVEGYTFYFLIGSFLFLLAALLIWKLLLEEKKPRRGGGKPRGGQGS